MHSFFHTAPSKETGGGSASLSSPASLVAQTQVESKTSLHAESVQTPANMAKLQAASDINDSVLDYLQSFTSKLATKGVIDSKDSFIPDLKKYYQNKEMPSAFEKLFDQMTELEEKSQVRAESKTLRKIHVESIRRVRLKLFFSYLYMQMNEQKKILLSIDPTYKAKGRLLEINNQIVNSLSHNVEEKTKNTFSNLELTVKNYLARPLLSVNIKTLLEATLLKCQNRTDDKPNKRNKKPVEELEASGSPVKNKRTGNISYDTLKRRQANLNYCLTYAYTSELSTLLYAGLPCKKNRSSTLGKRTRGVKANTNTNSKRARKEKPQSTTQVMQELLQIPCSALKKNEVSETKVNSNESYSEASVRQITAALAAYCEENNFKLDAIIFMLNFGNRIGDIFHFTLQEPLKSRQLEGWKKLTLCLQTLFDNREILSSSTITPVHTEFFSNMLSVLPAPASTTKALVTDNEQTPILNELAKNIRLFEMYNTAKLSPSVKEFIAKLTNKANQIACFHILDLPKSDQVAKLGQLIACLQKFNNEAEMLLGCDPRQEAEFISTFRQLLDNIESPIHATGSSSSGLSSFNMGSMDASENEDTPIFRF